MEEFKNILGCTICYTVVADAAFNCVKPLYVKA